MEDQGMLDSFQFAYRNDKSISQALLAFTLDVTNAMKSDETCIATFVDLEGAFDAVWRNGLVYKLYHAGIRGRMLLYVYSYLKDRVTRIIVNGYTSEWFENLIGVPQGSIIAPLLFIFYISEMTQLLHKRVSFADDLTSWVIKNNIPDACEEVKIEFLKLTGWTKKWRMSINAGKTDFILFGKSHQDIVIQIDSTRLPQVKSKKLLGVIIQEDLSFNEQVDSIRSKCFKAQSLLNPLMSTHNGAPAEIGVYLYESCTRAIIEATFPVWCNISQDSYRKIEEIQKRALKAATGTHHNTALSTLEVMTGVPPLRLKLEEVLINEFTRILSKHDSDPIKSLVLKLANCNKFSDNRMLSSLHLVKPLLKELGTDFITLNKTIEPAPKIRYSSENSVLPEFVRIDQGNWGSSNSRTNQQKEIAKETTKRFLLNEVKNDTLTAFLDGSALGNPGPCGASAIIYEEGFDAEPTAVRQAISPLSTSYHGELAALLLCVTTVLNSCLTKISSNVNILHIFSDCQSAIKSVISMKMLPSHQHIKENFLTTVSELLNKGIKTKISWVAGHVDLIANTHQFSTHSQHTPIQQIYTTHTNQAPIYNTCQNSTHIYNTHQNQAHICNTHQPCTHQPCTHIQHTPTQHTFTTHTNQTHIDNTNQPSAHIQYTPKPGTHIQHTTPQHTYALHCIYLYRLLLCCLIPAITYAILGLEKLQLTLRTQFVDN